MSDDGDDAPEAAGRPDPEAVRTAVRDYVWTVHTTYLDHVRHLPPGERATLPLVAAGHVTVAAAASRQLHLVATTQRLLGPTGTAVSVDDEYLDCRWTVWFYDPSVLPALGVLGPAEDESDRVCRALGIVDTTYHLEVSPGGGLSAHHAQHSGVALANQHAQVLRDVDRLRHALPRDLEVVEELATCARLGLDRAAALLAADLTDRRFVPLRGTPGTDSLAAVLADATRR
ncbi:hypothetical protein [Nocardioides litoris]|uniref:hypothetical protein n=1 Tax=Nocardioides litoris TaxID=1926648 RepID=UPI00111F0FA9|nr:hypothetical protein [Nocardioides litoris]